MELCKSCLSIQRFRSYSQPLEVIENIGLDTFQSRLCDLDVISINSKGQILCFNETVISSCQLVLKHCRVFRADTVKIISLRRNGNRICKGFFRCSKVQKRQLEMNRAVKIIEEVTPALKNCGFILVLRKLVVNVLKLNCFCIVRFCHPADSIRPHPFIRNTVLR